MSVASTVPQQIFSLFMHVVVLSTQIMYHKQMMSWYVLLVWSCWSYVRGQTSLWSYIRYLRSTNKLTSWWIQFHTPNSKNLLILIPSYYVINPLCFLLIIFLFPPLAFFKMEDSHKILVLIEVSVLNNKNCSATFQDNNILNNYIMN